MAGQAEWEARRRGVLRRAPQQPRLEDVVLLSEDDIVERLGCSPDNHRRCEKLIEGLVNVLCQYVTEWEYEDHFYSGSFGRSVALNYEFDVDLVVVVSDFNSECMGEQGEYFQDCWNAMGNFRRRVDWVDSTPYCMKLVLGDFVDVDLLLTGDPDYNYHNRQRYYSAFGSQEVDLSLTRFQSRHTAFQPLVLLCKHWRNLREETHYLSSFFMELVCKHIVESNWHSNIPELFRSFLQWFLDGNDRIRNPNPYTDRYLKLKADTAHNVRNHASATLQKMKAYLRPGNHFSCPLCGLNRFLSAGGAAQHVESGRCPHCPGAENARNQIYNFVSSHPKSKGLLNPMLTNGYGGQGSTNSDWYRCNHCERTFPQLSSLLSHKADKHGQAPRLALGW